MQVKTRLPVGKSPGVAFKAMRSGQRNAQERGAFAAATGLVIAALALGELVNAKNWVVRVRLARIQLADILSSDGYIACCAFHGSGETGFCAGTRVS